MKIRYSRSGGFANITTGAELDVSKLPGKRAKDLQKLITRAGVFDLPAGHSKKTRMADDIQHDLEIEESGRHCHIRRNDSECDPELLQLFDLLYKEILRKS